MSAIARLAPPHNVNAVRAFLGLVGYYRRFIEQFAKIAKPLTQLTSIDRPFSWGSVEEEAFRKLQRQLTEATMVHTPTTSGRFRIYTDYCSEALGAALHQV